MYEASPSPLVGAEHEHFDEKCRLSFGRNWPSMKEKSLTNDEPAWLDPRNERKTPYSEAELDNLTEDQIAMLADTPAWRKLVAEVGMQRARDIVRQRLAGRDPNSLINWQPGGAMH